MAGYPDQKRKTPGRMFWRLCMQTAGAIGVFFMMISFLQQPVAENEHWKLAIQRWFTDDADITAVVRLIENRFLDSEAIEASAFPVGYRVYEEMAVPVSGTVVQQNQEEGMLGIITDGLEDVLVAYDGTVTDVRADQNQLICITVSHPNGLITKYGGCETCYVQVQQPVKKGQKIGNTRSVVSDKGSMNTGNFYFSASYLGTAINPLDLMVQYEIDI